jgi:hypothetical protein
MFGAARQHLVPARFWWSASSGLGTINENERLSDKAALSALVSVAPARPRLPLPPSPEAGSCTFRALSSSSETRRQVTAQLSALFRKFIDFSATA